MVAMKTTPVVNLQTSPTIDHDKNPVELDMCLKRFDSEETDTMFFIIEFIDANTIKIEFDENSRPKEFTEDDFAVLVRSD
jgi:hypothetical protein